MSILHISASPQQAGSHSRELGRHLVERLTSAIDLPVVVRDLAVAPPPFPCASFVQASLSASTKSFANKSDALTVSEHLIAEVEQASAIIIDMPMHNFTVPAAFKAWIDMVVRPERTFRPTSSGKIGLLEERPVALIIACGGLFSGGAASQPDFLTPYVTRIFQTLGFGDVTSVRLEGTARAPEFVAKAKAQAKAELDKIAIRFETILLSELSHSAPPHEHSFD